MMLSSPQEWNACAHIVATHDSQQLKSLRSVSKETVGNDSDQSLSVVTATKESLGSESIRSLSVVRASEVSP